MDNLLNSFIDTDLDINNNIMDEENQDVDNSILNQPEKKKEAVKKKKIY